MCDKINKEFEEFQRQLEIRNKKLKPVFKFDYDDDLDELLDELKEKKIEL